MRDALNNFMKELEATERKTLMEKKAKELSSDYNKSQLMTLFSKIVEEDDT